MTTCDWCGEPIIAGENMVVQSRGPSRGATCDGPAWHEDCHGAFKDHFKAKNPFRHDFGATPPQGERKRPPEYVA